MILINLLPHREERRRQRKRAFFAGLGVAAAVGAGVAALWYATLQQMTAAQQARNGFLREQTVKLEAQIKDIATLRTEIDGLKARQGAVEDLQLNRNVPVYLLDELVRQTPEGVYLTAIRQTDASVLVNGLAQTNERVSEMLRNVQTRSQWLNPPELVEIKAITQAPTGPGARGETRRLYEFSMRVSLKLPGAPASAPSTGASAPGTRRSA